MITGINRRDTISKNWQYWGSGGIFSAHVGYELGVSSAISLGSFKSIGIKEQDLERIENEGFIPYFLESIKVIDDLGTYQEYMKTGWSAYLGGTTRRKLAPLIMKNVCLAWYATTKGISE